MNARGSVILYGLILTGMIGAATITAGTYYEHFSHQARVTQIRSRMTSLESLIRSMAFQPYSYDCGTENGGLAISAINTCTIRGKYYDEVSKVVMPGSKCPDGTTGTCGFELDGPVLDTPPNSAVGIFRATIHYRGTEISELRPSDIRLEIPTELLKSAVFDCARATPTTPVLVGFKADGTPNCRGFRPIVNNAPGNETAPCPQGTYASQVQWNSLTFTCTNLATPDKVINCGPSQMIGEAHWTEGVLTAPCIYLPEAPFQ